MASLDRDCRVLASSGNDVVDLDHDFSKAKLTPSVAPSIDIPDSITECFYQGKIFVGVKDAVFSPSYPAAFDSPTEMEGLSSKLRNVQ